MARSSQSYDEAIQRAVRSYRTRSNSWTGCDWTTQFGARRLDLNGLTARQAKMMADATPGSESACWLKAVEWLQRVEADAQSAELAAKRAIELLPQDASAALAQIQKACKLERKYRKPRVWSVLCDEIQAISGLT